MNFISRNLGWLLLFLFFLFMLFIISTNQKKDSEKSVSGSTSSVEVSTGETVAIDSHGSELDKLVEKITEEEIPVSEEASLKGKEKDMESTGVLVEPKKSIFDIFKRKEVTEEVVVSTGMLDNDNADQEVIIEKKTTTVAPSVQVKNNSGQGLTKTTGTSKALAAESIYFDTPSKKLQLQLPGVNLKTEIGKEFQVGVTALKLNNKNFTQKLAYMSHGDILKQLSQENKIGCFQVKILSSSTKTNVGKIGYVCKKYLSDISAINTSTSMVNPENNKMTPEVKTFEGKNYFKPINDIVSLMDRKLITDIVGLESTDILLQISPVEQNGAFEVKIVGSNTLEKHSIKGYVKLSEVKSYTIPN